MIKIRMPCLVDEETSGKSRLVDSSKRYRREEDPGLGPRPVVRNGPTPVRPEAALPREAMSPPRSRSVDQLCSEDWLGRPMGWP